MASPLSRKAEQHAAYSCLQVLPYNHARAEKTRKGLNVEEQFLTYYSMQLIREYELYFHVPTLSDNEVKLMSFFNNFRNPQDVISGAYKKLGEEADVAVFIEAGATFPILRQSPV